ESQQDLYVSFLTYKVRVSIDDVRIDGSDIRLRSSAADGIKSLFRYEMSRIWDDVFGKRPDAQLLPLIVDSFSKVKTNDRRIDLVILAPVLTKSPFDSSSKKIEGFEFFHFRQSRKN